MEPPASAAGRIRPVQFAFPRRLSVSHSGYSEPHGKTSDVTGRKGCAVVDLVRKVSCAECANNSRIVGRNRRSACINQPNDSVVCSIRGEDGRGALWTQNFRRLRCNRHCIEDASSHGERSQPAISSRDIDETVPVQRSAEYGGIAYGHRLNASRRKCQTGRAASSCNPRLRTAAGR
jgi:hypothetical protein